MEEDGYEIFHTAHMSVTERLIACLKNETMTDVALVGDDGIPVPACRYILGSASAVFQPLLYGNFKAESDSSTVTIQASNQKSLTALVEFCCSDELNTSIWADAHPLEIVQDTVALAKLAHTYEIPNLQGKVKQFLDPLMIAYPPLACSVFNLADAVATPDIHIASLVIIQEQAYTALSSIRKDGTKTYVGGMTCLSPEKLEEILADNEVEADELFLFRELVLWRDHNASRYKHINSICKSVVRHLDLSSIDPNEIETTVMNSGFVDASMLVKALMAQAKSATNEGLAFASLQGPRGRKYAHVLVEGAGEEDCNGVYVHVKNDKLSTSGETGNLSTSKNLLYFIKRPDGAGSSGASMKGNNQNSSMITTKRTFVLVQDSNGIWRICDSYKNILYEWDQRTNDETRNDKTSFPHKGWTSVSGELPPPECSWLRPHTTQKGGNNAAQAQIDPSTQLAPSVPPVEATEGGTNNRESAHKNESTTSSKGSTESQKNLHENVQSTLGTRGKEADIDKVHSNNEGLVVVGNERTKQAAGNSTPLTKQPVPLNVFDGSSSRKSVTTKAGTKKEKRKNPRMSSLMDNAKDDVATVAVEIKKPNNDPILGTTIGGDGFVIDDKNDNNISTKKKDFNDLHVGNGPASPAFNNKGPSSSSINNYRSSAVHLSCISPAPNGELLC